MAHLRSTHQIKIAQPSSKSPLNDNNHQHSSSSSNQKLFLTSIFILSLSLILFVVLSFRSNPFYSPIESSSHRNGLNSLALSLHENWSAQMLDMVVKDLNRKTTKSKIKIGAVNLDTSERLHYKSLNMVETLVVVDFPRVSTNLTWGDFFPSWVDESGKKQDTASCPEIPMPRLEEPRYRDLDVVVARVPCFEKGRHMINNGSEGIRDVFRLQVHLVVANLVVGNGDRDVYVVFVGSCGPMLEIFRCDDMLTHLDDYWVYKPDLARLKEKVLMPVGSCQVVPAFGHRGRLSSFKDQKKQAYVTVLHSSESYVCGAISLAQSIKLTNSTRDLVLLHDSTITPSSLAGLRLAGWSTRLIQPIRSTFAEKGSYNEWNYSKLRIWQQLTDYDKVIFVDSDLLVLRNMDEIFTYPQLSASFNTAPNETVFNSGVMVIEPSNCMFEDIMAKTSHLASINGGDQGFLNEVFTWWHRLPRKVNWQKMFDGREPPEGVYGLHFLGRKPWMCYRDYDCNWDVAGRDIFASDVAHRKWWEVYDGMPKGLQKYCGLTKKMDDKIKERREIAKSEKKKKKQLLLITHEGPLVKVIGKIMALSRSAHYNSSSSSNQKLFISSISILSFALILLILSFRSNPLVSSVDSSRHVLLDPSSPRGDDSGAHHFPRMVVKNDSVGTNAHGKIRIGLVNVDTSERRSYESMDAVETVVVDFPRVSTNLTWKDLFPTWLDEESDQPLEVNSCPETLMPNLEEPRYQDLDVVVARVPCGENNNASEGIRDVFRLQINLVVAKLIVRNEGRKGYVIFTGSCGPMPEIFRCDDMLVHVGDYWVYKPDSTRLKKILSMPVGSCRIAPLFGSRGKEGHGFQGQQKEAYVTVLHSSEAYVCGAIALAQSIKLANSTRDLVLLHDSSLSQSSLFGLRLAGWSTRLIQPIRSTFAKKGSYNEWNYSKLRIWQVKDYTKVVFIDSDLLVLRNMDDIFKYPQLSAAPNDDHLFNSGIMVIEPSECTFDDLMSKTSLIASYNGGDQGFLNEVFPWWHRLPRKINWLKMFEGRNDGTDDEEGASREPEEGVYGMHFLGWKPWMCYRDYDCNWNMVGRHRFASDGAHRKWWEVYDAMPKGLKEYCGLTRENDDRIKKWRKIAESKKFKNGRWRIRVTDPRKDNLID
ncbi:Putative UDP-glucuronate:xylan alpha-glucuronosyltransferase 4 [Linum grandiflorum]